MGVKVGMYSDDSVSSWVQTKASQQALQRDHGLLQRTKLCERACYRCALSDPTLGAPMLHSDGVIGARDAAIHRESLRSRALISCVVYIPSLPWHPNPTALIW